MYALMHILDNSYFIDTFVPLKKQYYINIEIMAKHPKFDLKKATDGQYYFNLTARNGEIILTSERYTRKENALNGIDSVKKNALLDGQYDRLVAKNGQHYFNLKAANHQIIGTSEMYVSKQGRDNGIESVKTNAPLAEIEEE